MKYAKNMLIAALACLSLAACAETETDDFPEETTTQTTAVEYIDYSDKYTPLYRDFFYAYTDLRICTSTYLHPYITTHLRNYIYTTLHFYLPRKLPNQARIAFSDTSEAHNHIL